jgi:hypothetical protein
MQSMELATEPDTYCPNIDEHGNYADRIPSFNTAALANGLRCPCGTRKDKVYASAAMFASHIKTKTHEKWLQDLNANKANFYIENKRLRDLVQSQKIMLGKMEVDLTNKSLTIDYLTQQLIAKNATQSTQSKSNSAVNVTDLISFE